MESFTDIWPLVNSGGIVGIGMLVLMWIVRGTLIPKRHHEEVVGNLTRSYDQQVGMLTSSYDELREREAYWRAKATDETARVDRALVVADTAVTHVAKVNGAP